MIVKIGKAYYNYTKCNIAPKHDAVHYTIRIGTVTLNPGKYWYEFIVDNNWIIDDDNLLRENDGLGNFNSVYFKPNVVFTLSNFSNAKKYLLQAALIIGGKKNCR